PLPGSPEDLVLQGLMHGRHVPGRAIDEGIPASILTDMAWVRDAVNAHPAAVFTDLPPRVRENLVQAATADAINGRDGRAGELLAEAAKVDPRIAESVGGIEAYHGSRHDFARFDASKIGTGEGAQSYGHGLYFAEEPKVGEAYRKKPSDQKTT